MKRAEIVAELRADYLRRVCLAAAQIRCARPEIVDIEGTDSFDYLEQSGNWLEKRCRAALCATTDDAWTVMLASPRRPDALVVMEGLTAAEDVREDAAIVAAHDVADALGVDWYRSYQTPPDELGDMPQSTGKLMPGKGKSGHGKKASEQQRVRG